jgi:hypothetical protein
MQYKFERVSRTEIKRTNLITFEKEIFGPIPNAKGEQIDVELFLKRKMNHPNNVIFGATEGQEVWFGGRRDITETKLDIVWDKIETDTTYRRNQTKFTRWPFTPKEKRIVLILPTDDFDDSIVSELMNDDAVIDNLGSPNEDRITLRQRKNFVDLDNILLPDDVRREDIFDDTKEIDLRGRITFDRSSIVQQKSPLSLNDENEIRRRQGKPERPAPDRGVGRG